MWFQNSKALANTLLKLYLAGLLDFGLYTYEDPQVLHHLSQFARIGIPVFTHIEHQTHRQAVLDEKIHKSRILKMN